MSSSATDIAEKLASAERNKKELQAEIRRNDKKIATMKRQQAIVNGLPYVEMRGKRQRKNDKYMGDGLDDQPPSKRYKCVNCGSIYDDLSSFNVHHYYICAQPFKCSTCNSCYESQQQLNTHVERKHWGVRIIFENGAGINESICKRFIFADRIVFVLMHKDHWNMEIITKIRCVSFV